MRNSSTVPNVGQQIDLDLSKIRHDDGSTPMAKIRLIQDHWTQVPVSEAGMLVFLDCEIEATHTKFEITRIIPSETGAYAVTL